MKCVPKFVPSRSGRDERRPVSLEVFGIETGWALSRPKIFETGRDAPVSSRSRRDGSTTTNSSFLGVQRMYKREGGNAIKPTAMAITMIHGG